MPAFPQHLTQTVHHDVYPAISAAHALQSTAKGLSVLVTGGGRGVGRAQALAFAQAGAAKVTLVSRSAAELAEVAREVAEVSGGKTVAVTAVADVSDEEAIRAAFDAAGEVHVLLNNAGAHEKSARLHEGTVDDWWRTWEVNVKGAYVPTREAIRRALAVSQKPNLTIINTSSLASILTLPNGSAYGPSKSATNRLAEFVHFEYEAEGIRSFAYHPGNIMTQFSSGVPPALRHFFIETTELAGGFALWLATSGARVDFLRGRYVSATWDVDELLAKKEEVEARDLLWTRVAGQEQVIKM